MLRLVPALFGRPFALFIYDFLLLGGQEVGGFHLLRVDFNLPLEPLDMLAVEKRTDHQQQDSHETAQNGPRVKTQEFVHCRPPV